MPKDKDKPPLTPTVSVSSLIAMAKLAESLANDGRNFHETDLVPGVEETARLMGLKKSDLVRDVEAPSGFRLSFPACIAIATGSWTVINGHATHAAKVLDLVNQQPSDATIDKFTHPRGNAVRRALHCWVPPLNSGELPRWPTFDELLPVYIAWVRDEDDYTWGILIAIKLYALLAGAGQGFSNAHINRFAPPLGRAVQAGMAAILGAAPGESPKAHRDAWNSHVHLARLAKSNVFVINSGFWVAGYGDADAVGDEEGG